MSQRVPPSPPCTVRSPFGRQRFNTKGGRLQNLCKEEDELSSVDIPGTGDLRNQVALALAFQEAQVNKPGGGRSAMTQCVHSICVMANADLAIHRQKRASKLVVREAEEFRHRAKV